MLAIELIRHWGASTAEFQIQKKPAHKHSYHPNRESQNACENSILYVVFLIKFKKRIKWFQTFMYYSSAC